MDPVTYVMVLSMLSLLAKGTLTIGEIKLSRLPARFSNAGSTLKSFGGFWYLFVGAPLAAWFLTTFFIMPLLGLSYNLNIQTVLNFAQPEVVIIFLVLWLGIALGAFGAASYHREGGKSHK
jgi:hypothetical protein